MGSSGQLNPSSKMEKTIHTPYGQIRRDKDNTPVSKRQLRKLKSSENNRSEDKQSQEYTNNERDISNEANSTTEKTERYGIEERYSTMGNNYFDEEVLKDYNRRKIDKQSVITEDATKTGRDNHDTNNISSSYDLSDMNYINDQYFGSYRGDNRTKSTDDVVYTSVIESRSSKFDESNTSYTIDSHSDINVAGNRNQTIIQLYAKITENDTMEKEKADHNANIPTFSEYPEQHDEHSHDSSESSFKPDVNGPRDAIIASDGTVRHNSRLNRYPHDKAKVHQQLEYRSKQIDIVIKPNIDEPKTAFDFVMKMRAQKAADALNISNNIEGAKHVPGKGERLDSKGYRIMRPHLIDFHKLTRSEIVDILHECIIYDQHDILAIDKPSGLPSHGGPGVIVSIGQFLGDLSLKLDPSGLTRLHLVHRLDKETTGVMVLAKTVEMASKLKTLFLERSVIKKYWVITKDIPNPTQGIIDIPIRESKVGSNYRMTLRPECTPETKDVVRKSRLKSSPAITNYKVLDSNNCSALVECQPETGKKHQIRVHLAQGLNTPILGDHKYSHFMRLLPQRLNPTMLQKLGVRQAKVRYIPMHLHAHAIVFPQLILGRNIRITIKPPRFFLKNMERLKLRNPFVTR